MQPKDHIINGLDIAKYHKETFNKVEKIRNIRYDQVPFKLLPCRYGLIVYPYYDYYIGSCLELYGEWSQIEIDFLCSLLSPGDTVIDVGAFIGTHTLSFAQKVQLEGKIYAFEPIPYLFNCLVSNVTINNYPNVEIFNLAIGSKKSKAKFRFLPFMQFNNFGNAGIVIDPSKDYADTVTVNIRSLDSFNLNQCKLIKIDVEGMGFEVLNGAKRIIKNYRPYILVEVEGANENEETEEIVDFISKYGYAVYKYYTPLYTPNNFFNNKNNLFELYYSYNLFLAPKEILFPNLKKIS